MWLKNTGVNLQTLQDKDLNVTLENNISGVQSCVMGVRHVKSDDNKKISYIDANNIYGHFMSQPLPYDETEMWHGHPDLYMNKLEKLINTSNASDIGYFVEVDLRDPDNLKEKQRIFHFD